MTTLRTNLPPSRFASNLSATRFILEHDPITTDLPVISSPRGTSFTVNGVIAVAMKCPVATRDNICLELLHETTDGNWSQSWFATCEADAYLWVLPEGRHLWVNRLHLLQYERHETKGMPLTNHSASTQLVLAAQGVPANVVTRWVPIADVIDKTSALCYDVEKYNPATLKEWLDAAHIAS